MEHLEPWLSVVEIADYLNVSTVSVYRLIQDGCIPCHKVGRLWRFKASHVDSWISQGGGKLSLKKVPKKLPKFPV